MTDRTNLSAIMSVFEPQPPHITHTDPAPYRNSNELGTKKILYSRQQRRVGLLIVEATSNKRLRCDFSMEGKPSGSGTIRHIIQVRGYCSTVGSLRCSETYSYFVQVPTIWE
jgi:hypothetical protein